MRTPSSYGLEGSPPQCGGIGSREVAIKGPRMVTCSVQVLGGPARNLTSFGASGSVTSTIDQPLCQRWPTYRYQRPPTTWSASLNPGRFSRSWYARGWIGPPIASTQSVLIFTIFLTAGPLKTLEQSSSWVLHGSPMGPVRLAVVASPSPGPTARPR